MKFTSFLIFSFAVGMLQAQTLTDPEPSAEDPISMLELPPATVVDEDGKSSPTVEIEADDTSEISPDDSQATEPEENTGIQIQIEKTAQKSGARHEKGKVKVYSPWPAKPISSPPIGWKFAPAPKGTEPFRTQVTLSSGNTVDLSITPYVIVPLSDGKTSIKISEPGYNAAQQSQEDTMGVMLYNSITEIENHEKHAADTIQRLQQLLSSLPRQ